MQLESLQDLNKEDYKITMNKAVAEFYKSGQTTTGTLKQTLMALKSQVRTIMCHIFGNTWSKMCVWDVRTIFFLFFLSFKVHTAVDDIDGLDDVENSILYYNQAIIHYHMRQYSEAIAIGEKLYQFLEPFGMIQVKSHDNFSNGLTSVL